MSNNIIFFKNIKFYNLSPRKVLKKMIDEGGYLVAPAASSLQTISKNKSYHRALQDSTIAILKVRGGLLDDVGGNNNDLHKPSIFSSGNNLHYSEDSVFSLFSCISYELMKLLKGHTGNNNGGGGGHTGLQTIPASIELI